MRPTVRSFVPAAAVVLSSVLLAACDVEKTSAASAPPAATVAAAAPAPAAPPVAAATPASLVRRGEQLVSIGGCNDCHTPMKFDEKLGMPVPDMSRRLTGHPAGAPDPASKLSAPDQAVIGPTFTAFRLPFGVVYAANLTPDRETGLGGWTEEQFVKTMRTGRHLGLPNGRPVLPPMPWATLAQQSDDDLRAIWAYLASLPPASNRVPQPQVPPPALEGIGASYAKLLAAAPK